MQINFKIRLLAILFTSLFLLASPAQAKHFNTGYFNGPYIGGHVGLKDFSIRNESVVLSSLLTVNTNSKTYLSDENVTDGFNLGLGITYGRLYLGAEFTKDFGQVSSIEPKNFGLIANIITNNQNLDVRVRFGTSLTFNPGVLLSPTTLLYAAVGCESAKLIVSSQSTTSVFLTSLTATANQHRNITGFRVGVGLLKYIGNHLAIGLEFDHANFGAQEFNAIGSLGPLGIINTALLNKLATSDNTWVFKANWYFKNPERGHSKLASINVSPPYRAQYKTRPSSNKKLPPPMATATPLPQPFNTRAISPKTNISHLS